MTYQPSAQVGKGYVIVMFDKLDAQIKKNYQMEGQKQ